ncbi:hypothetical protein pb186bvf_010000 [Paramecium bursaria]
MKYLLVRFSGEQQSCQICRDCIKCIRPCLQVFPTIPQLTDFVKLFIQQFSLRFQFCDPICDYQDQQQTLIIFYLQTNDIGQVQRTLNVIKLLIIFNLQKNSQNIAVISIIIINILLFQMNCCGQQEQDQSIKDAVKDAYGQIAKQSKDSNEQSFCGVGTGCGTIDYAIFAENYQNLEGYDPNADLGLGCGIPTEFAQVRKGHIVLDLGSGAGNDCFVARALCGPEGKVIGVDMTPEMIRKAQLNSDKNGFRNVEFRFGDIENLPILDNFIDVVISNCVINLVPDKRKVFREIYRVLKPGGMFSISDVLTTGILPASIRKGSELYVGCVSGALLREEQIEIIKEIGFNDVEIKKEKTIHAPDELLLKYVNQEELADFRNSGVKIISATIVARK